MSDFSVCDRGRDARNGVRPIAREDDAIAAAKSGARYADGLSTCWNNPLIAARTFDSSADHFADFAALEAYLDETSGRLMRLAAQVLEGPQNIAPTLREAGLAYGLTGLLRALPFHNGRHKLYLPLDLLSALNLTPEAFFHLGTTEPRRASAMRQVALKARDHFLAARQAPKPGAALAAILPAALVPVYLRRLGRDVPIHRRQMALLSAAMKKRL